MAPLWESARSAQRRSAQVLDSWCSVFDGVPDFSGELVDSWVNAHIEWGDRNWRGRHVHGSPFAMRGVTILVVLQDLVAEGRLLMEPVEADDGDIKPASRSCTGRHRRRTDRRQVTQAIRNRPQGR